MLDLLKGRLDAEPTTAYLMTFKEGKCTANCEFCPQARGSKSSADLLSRVTWPAFPTDIVVNALEDAVKRRKIRRVCIQALNYPQVFSHLQAVVRKIKKQAHVQVSVSCQPFTKANIELLANAGVDRLGIPLDACSEEVFNKVKGEEAGGPYSWENQFRILMEALAVFGQGNVSTHVIVGLGETEKEAAQVIQRCVDMSVLPALFAFTPIRGTAMEKHQPPSLESYRRLQLARYLMVYNLARIDDLTFGDNEKIINFGLPKEDLDRVVESGAPFRTSGCPDCNRPFYNEKPSGPFYNYPDKISSQELEQIKKELSQV